MGTKSSYNNEWIELYNNTDSPINLDGWILKAADDVPTIKLAGSFLANGFYLLERSKDYTGALNNKGEKLELCDDSGNLIDFADGSAGWPAGDNSTKQTMSRFSLDQWKSSKEPGGTPKAPNTFVVDAPEIRTVEPQSNTQPNRELAAVGQQVIQKPPLFLLIAGVLAVFSGAIILILKKKLN